MFSDAEIKAVLRSQEFKKAFASGGEYEKFVVSVKRCYDIYFSPDSFESWQTLIDELSHHEGGRRAALKHIKIYYPEVFELFQSTPKYKPPMCKKCDRPMKVKHTRDGYRELECKECDQEKIERMDGK